MSGEGKIISVRIPVHELAALDEKAEAAGVSRSEFLRRRITSRLDPEDPTSGAIELLAALEAEIKLLSDTRRVCLESGQLLADTAAALEESGDEEVLELAGEAMRSLDGLLDSSLDALQRTISCREVVRQSLGLE